MTQANKKVYDYLCGLHAIELCLVKQDHPHYRAKPKELWVQQGNPIDPVILKLLKEYRIPVVSKMVPKDPKDDILRDLKQHSHLLWIESQHGALEHFPWQSTKTIVIVDHITDTQNLGAIIRSACALGVDALFYPKHSQASITPRVRFIAQGATEWLPCYQIANINQFINTAKKEGFWVYGFAETGNTELQAVSFEEKSVLVIGSEDRGIRKQTLGLCDFVVKIPSSSHFSCLNAASAASVVFYERQRNKYSLTSR